MPSSRLTASVVHFRQASSSFSCLWPIDARLSELFRSLQQPAFPASPIVSVRSTVGQVVDYFGSQFLGSRRVYLCWPTLAVSPSSTSRRIASERVTPLAVAQASTSAISVAGIRVIAGGVRPEGELPRALFDDTVFI